MKTAGRFLLLFLLLPLPLAADADFEAMGVLGRMMRKTGGEAFPEAGYIGFEIVELEGGIERARRRHEWEPPTNRCRLAWVSSDGAFLEAVIDLDALSRGEVWRDGEPLPADDAAPYLLEAHRQFLRDDYWLFMPFRWLDPGVDLTYIGRERHLDGSYDVVLVRHGEGTAFTPGDRYWAYVDRKTGRMERWDMLREEREEKPRTVLWKEWGWHGDMLLASHREFPGSRREIRFEKIDITRGRRPGEFDRPSGLRLPVPELPPTAATPPKPDAEPSRPATPPPPVSPARTAAPSAPPVAPREPEPVAPAKAASPRGTLVVLNKAGATAALVDPSSLGVRATLPAGMAPHEVAVDPTGRFAFISNYGHFQSGNTLTLLDLAEASTLGEWELGVERPHGLAFDRDGRLWVTSETEKAVLRLELPPLPAGAESGPAETVRYPTGQEVSHMIAVAPSGRAFVANIGSGTVTAIDPETRATRQIAVGQGPEGIAVRPGGGEVWVVNRYGDTLSVIDAASMEVVATVPTGPFPIRLAFTPDGRHALVSCLRANEVWVHDADTRQKVRAIEAGEAPIGIVVEPSGERAYVAATKADRVQVLDLKRWEKAGSIETGDEPDGMAWAASPAGRKEQ